MRGVYFNAVHYFCTEANKDGGILHCMCMQTYLFTQHIHTHTCAHMLNKALLQRQNGSWMNPVLFDLVHSQSEWCCFSRSVRSLLGSLGVALHTQDLAIQWIAAIFIRFYGERTSTILRNKQIHLFISILLLLRVYWIFHVYCDNILYKCLTSQR